MAYSPEEMFFISKAIVNLRPLSNHWYQNGKLVWKDEQQTEPTQVEIDIELIAVKAEYYAQAYARNRANSYPSITNVVVALAEKAEGRSAMWDEITAQRLDVKSKYPKP